MNESIAVGSRRVGPGEPVFIIAEIGLNHNGEYDLAEKMIRGAAECGIDAVKFQTFKTDLFLSKGFPGYEERKGLSPLALTIMSASNAAEAAANLPRTSSVSPRNASTPFSIAHIANGSSHERSVVAKTIVFTPSVSRMRFTR